MAHDLISSSSSTQLVMENDVPRQEFDISDMPNIMYQLQPTDDWRKNARLDLPPPKRDSNGRVMVELFPSSGEEPRPLLDFQCLPDRISSQESWLVLEYYRRLDGRIRWDDITMRMMQPPTTSALTSEAWRGRKKFSMLAWKQPERNADYIKKKEGCSLLKDEHIQSNNTRGLIPSLINPAQGENGGRNKPPRIAVRRNKRNQNRHSHARRLGEQLEHHSSPGTDSSTDISILPQENSTPPLAESVPMVGPHSAPGPEPIYQGPFFQSQPVTTCQTNQPEDFHEFETPNITSHTYDFTISSVQSSGWMVRPSEFTSYNSAADLRPATNEIERSDPNSSSRHIPSLRVAQTPQLDVSAEELYLTNDIENWIVNSYLDDYLG